MEIFFPIEHLQTIVGSIHKGKGTGIIFAACYYWELEETPTLVSPSLKD